MTRLFVALELDAPWPEKLPAGRIIEAKHMTLDFLGEADPEEALQNMHRYQLKIGPVGYFDKCLALPKRHWRALSWHMVLFTQKEIATDILAHATIARKPFDLAAWQKAFIPLPFVATAVHLYESLGNSRYKSLHTHDLVHPFEEMEHTADIAFKIRAEHIHELYFTAAIALSFHYTPFLQYIEKDGLYTTLDEVVSKLNTMIALADSAQGCPLKAVSYHGEVRTREDGVLEWEMIVDV